MSSKPDIGESAATLRHFGGTTILARLRTLFERLGPGTAVAIGFVLIIIVGSLVSPYFMTQRNITNVLLQSAMLGVVAVGMTFVILTAGIDLSVGSVVSLCSVVAALLYDNGHGWGFPAVLVS